jgi:replicative DNA helicase
VSHQTTSINAGPPPGDSEPESTVAAAPIVQPTPTPTVETATAVETATTVEVEPKKPTIFLTPDLKLIHAIFQAGIDGYFTARRAGIKPEALFDEARPIWELMEEMMKLGRLPSFTEVHLKTAIEIIELCPEPIDVELAAQFIIKRTLTSQLHKKLQPFIRDDKINDDPFGTRDRLIEIYQETAWGLGEPVSINSRYAVEKLMAGYNKAASRGDSLLGLSSPWPTPDSASLGLQPGELTVVFAKRKIGKCLTADTILHCPSTGAERTIGELHEDCVNDYRRLDWSVHTWEKHRPIYKIAPSDFMDVGEKECVEILYRSGRTMTVGLEHPMLTPRGWLNAQDLEAGHHTGSIARLPAPSKPWKRLLDYEVKLLAYMIAEGGCTKPSTPTFTSTVPELVLEMEEICSAMNTVLRPAKDRSGTYYLVEAKPAPGTVHAVDRLRRNDLMEKKSIEKSIPTKVFRLADDLLGIFLGRLWSCDGSVEKSGMVSYSTGSKRMAFQIQHLLLRFGVTSRVRTIKRDTKDGERDYYEIYVHRRCVERFKAHVKLIGPKAKRIQEVFFQGRDRVGFLKNEEVRDLVYAEMESRPDLLKEVGEELGYSFKFQKGHVFDSKSGRVRRKVFEAFCEIYGSELKWILDENLWWDEIVSITPVGKKQCYDFSIPETECYIANDFIVHNSWLVIVWTVHMWRKDLKPGEKILFVTMEMTELQIMRRMACVDLKLPWNDLREGKLDMHQKKALDDWCADRIAHAGDPSKSNIIFATSKQCRTAKDIGALVAEIKPVCVVVDAFYILGRGDGKSIYEKVLGNVEALKLDVALQYDVPVLASTQLKGTIGKDTLSADSDDAMGAKAIGDYADVTRGLFADEELWTAQERLWRGMEAREFKPKDVHINFNFDRMDFSEIDEITGQDFRKAQKGDKEEGESGFKKKPPKPSAKQIQSAAENLVPDEDDGDEMSI